MKSLRQVLGEAQQNKVGIGHVNVSDLAALEAVFEAKNRGRPRMI